MHVLIITGGSVDDAFAEQYIKSYQWDLLISADAGMEFCRRAGILPDLLLGDFDSAKTDTQRYFGQRCPERIRRFAAEKDETDTELAILEAISAGADQITILGGTGTRLDHVLGNIHLLKLALDRGVFCSLVDSHNRIRMIKEKLVIHRETQFGKYVSLLPFTPEVTGVTLTGFVYGLENYTLRSGRAIGVSNEIRDACAEIRFDSGILLVIESKD